MIELDMPICLRCSSSNVAAFDPVEHDGRKLSQHVCNACDYVWWMDVDPPAMKDVDLYISKEIRLERYNAALREIIANQTKVIENYQEMLDAKEEKEMAIRAEIAILTLTRGSARHMAASVQWSAEVVEKMEEHHNIIAELVERVNAHNAALVQVVDMVNAHERDIVNVVNAPGEAGTGREE